MGVPRTYWTTDSPLGLPVRQNYLSVVTTRISLFGRTVQTSMSIIMQIRSLFACICKLQPGIPLVTKATVFFYSKKGLLTTIYLGTAVYQTFMAASVDLMTRPHHPLGTTLQGFPLSWKWKLSLFTNTDFCCFGIHVSGSRHRHPAGVCRSSFSDVRLRADSSLRNAPHLRLHGTLSCIGLGVE